MINARITDCNGSKALSVNGEIIPPMAMCVWNKYYDFGEFNKKVYDGYAKTGIRIYVVQCATNWFNPNSHDYIKYYVENILSVIPDAYMSCIRR